MLERIFEKFEHRNYSHSHFFLPQSGEWDNGVSYFLDTHSNVWLQVQSGLRNFCQYKIAFANGHLLLWLEKNIIIICWNAFQLKLSFHEWLSPLCYRYCAYIANIVLRNDQQWRFSIQWPALCVLLIHKKKTILRVLILLTLPTHNVEHWLNGTHFTNKHDRKTFATLQN